MIEKTPSKNNSEDIVKLARERFKLAEEAESKIREVGLEDLKFRAGDQWPEEVVKERNVDGRPCLTINRIPQFIRQITNDQRQNRPSIKISPVDDKADIETAKVYEGLIRHIQYNSNADVAYDTAFEGAVTKGFGYFRIITDYVDDRSFDQEILIKKIQNSFSVYCDPFAKESDGSDMNWCLIVDNMSHEEYKENYKDSDLASMEDWSSIGDKTAGWVQGKSCRIAEYFYKDYKEVTICQMTDGSVVEKSDLPEEFYSQIVNERKSSIPTVKWLKINGIEILEETEWPGKYIPVIPVYGDELNVDGEKILEGVIRHAKDSQRMYNYWASTETETIALAPKAPYIVAEGQLEGHERAWKESNRKNQAVLTYKVKSVDGNLLPAPQRNSFEPPVQAVSNARALASEDLKATTGIYDAALGNRSNENSGIAIQRRNVQSQTSNFHFVDNLTRSLRHAGKILIDLIPKIYDSARAARILGEDGQQEIIMLNQMFVKDGKPVEYNLGVGKYDVVVETGPSYATKRQEAAASMLDLSKAAPQLMQVAGDLLVKNMDWPGATEIAERIKKTLPPGIADEKDKSKQIPPEAQAQMQQMNQMIQQMTEQLNQANDQLKTKSVELQSKERIEIEKLQSQERIKAAELELEYVKLQTTTNVNAANDAIIRELAHINAMQELSEGKNHELSESPGFEQSEDAQEQQQTTGGYSSGQPTGV